MDAPSSNKSIGSPDQFVEFLVFLPEIIKAEDRRRRTAAAGSSSSMYCMIDVFYLLLVLYYYYSHSQIL